MCCCIALHMSTAGQLYAHVTCLACCAPRTFYCTGMYRNRRTPQDQCLPAAQASPPVLLDDEGVVALLRDDFMGEAEEAATAVDIMTFRNHCVEQSGG